MSVDIWKYRNTQYKCYEVALRITYIKNVKFKMIKIENKDRLSM